MLMNALTVLAERLDRKFGWDNLPLPLGFLTLVGLRTRLRERNLLDTGVPAASASELEDARLASKRVERQWDGTYNDLSSPRMGSIGAPFGRNTTALFEPDAAILASPNPRTVSRELLTRDTFLPATTLNVLAAAWIQFQVHDWLNHDKDEPDPDDPGRRGVAREWQLTEETNGRREAGPPMALARLVRDGATTEGRPAYLSRETHWWDASQLYGTRPKFFAQLRAEDGELLVDDALLAKIEQFTRPSDPEANMWIGLAALHLLFAREHNAICRRLREVYPNWDGDRIYAKARLINTAIMAKIHTVEWTPAIIAHPTTSRAIRATWSGLLGERARRRFGRIGQSEIWSGIPGSRTDHHGVPYSLTEEFVSVYRLHPLIPDDFSFRRVSDDAAVGAYDLLQLTVAPDEPERPRKRLEEIGGIANALYSLGIANPGEVTLHNYPRALQELVRFDGRPLDLAAADIVRSREAGLARYNNFRRLFRLAPAASFDDLTSNPAWAEQIREVYDGDLENVDLMIGLFGERKPVGFGFSDTAFRVFLLMATRRLQSDRFFTRDYTPEVYTPAGLDWIENTSMIDVLLRHYPELAPALAPVGNAFVPWARVSGRG